MKPITKASAWGLLAALAVLAVSAPVLADPDSQQKNKNSWRNLGIAGAVIAGYGLLTHNQTATVVGAAGAAYSANRYEQDRHHQSQDSANRQWYYQNNGYDQNNGNYPTNNYGYGRTYGWNPPASDNNGGYTDNGSSNNGYSGDNNGYGGDTSQQAFARRSNGRRLGWDKKPYHADRDGN